MQRENYCIHSFTMDWRASIDFSFLELCLSSIFDEKLKIFQRIDLFFFMQIIAVSTLEEVE